MKWGGRGQTRSHLGDARMEGGAGGGARGGRGERGGLQRGKPTCGRSVALNGCRSRVNGPFPRRMIVSGFLGIWCFAWCDLRQKMLHTESYTGAFVCSNHTQFLLESWREGYLWKPESQRVRVLGLKRTRRRVIPRCSTDVSMRFRLYQAYICPSSRGQCV